MVPDAAFVGAGENPNGLLLGGAAAAAARAALATATASAAAAVASTELFLKTIVGPLAFPWGCVVIPMGSTDGVVEDNDDDDEEEAGIA